MNQLFKITLFFLVVFLSNSLFASDPGIKLIENKGQWRADVFYSAGLPGGQLFLQKDRMTYSFYDSDFIESKHFHQVGSKRHLKDSHTSISAIPDEDYIKMHAFDVLFTGSNSSVEITSSMPYPTIYNYYLGNDADNWASNARAYEEVEYTDIYDCIDLKVYSGDHLKYDFIVHPGADVAAIKLQYKGLNNMFIKDGHLHMTTSLNEVIEQAPYAYQIINGDTTEVKVSFQLDKADQITYHFPDEYDVAYELVIDPLLVFASFSGSTADNFGYTATFDDSGNLYSGGIVFNQGFPVTTGAFQQAYNGGTIDIGILKFDSTGTNLLYATYLGGSSDESPHSLIVDGNEQLIVLGSTSSLNFPTTSNAYDRTFNGGSPQPNLLGYLPYTNGVDVFLTKLSANGGSLIGSTYVGGAADDGVVLGGDQLRKNYGDEFRGDVTIDADGFIYVATSSRSADFFSNASGLSSFNLVKKGTSDGVVFKMNQDLSAMLWGGFLGGGGEDAAFSIKIGSDNSVYVGGGTLAAADAFPTTSGALHEQAIGGIDGFVTKISSDGTSLLSSTLVGTTQYDQVYFIDLDADENVYLLGQTRGGYPVTSGAYSVPNSGQFIHKLSNDLSTTLFSMVFGSGTREPNISPTAFLVNDCDNLYVSGWGGVVNNNNSGITGSTNGMHVTADAFKKETDGSDIYLMSLSSDGSELLYATFFGASNNGGDHVDGGTNRFDKRGIIYQAVCSCGGEADDFPVTPGAYAQVNLGVRNGVQRCNNAVFKFDMATLRARIQTNTISFSQPDIVNICLPEDIIFQNLSIGGEIYEWDFGDGSGVTKTDTSYIVHNYKVPGSYKITLKVIDPNTCIGEDIATTFVNVSTPIYTVSDDAQICFGEEFRLEASGGVTYQWASADNGFLSGERNPKVKPEDTTLYFVTVTDAYGCKARDTVLLEVVPEVVVDFTVEKAFDCFSRPSLLLTNTSNQQDDYLWDFGDGNTSSEQQLTYEYVQDGSYDIALVGFRDFCVFEKHMTVNMKTVKVPNVITPSVPGHNDYFVIEADTPVNLKIYNRWGAILYESNDYKNNWNGEDQVSGVYYYEANITDAVLCKGWLHVIK